MNISKLKPACDKLILKKLNDAKTVTPGGMVIPDTAQKTSSQTSEIVAVGSDVKDLKPGDIVVTARWKCWDFRQDGDEFLVFREVMILAKLEKN